MQAVPYMLAAVVIGALASMRPALNAILARAVGGAYGATLKSVLGALLFFVCIVAGRLPGAMAMDRRGAFGLRVREVSGRRALGFGLVVSGASVVLRG